MEIHDIQLVLCASCVNDAVDAGELLDLRRRLPKLEYGVCLDNPPDCQLRPSDDWLDELVARFESCGEKHALSYHFCGRFAEALLAGKDAAWRQLEELACIRSSTMSRLVLRPSSNDSLNVTGLFAPRPFRVDLVCRALADVDVMRNVQLMQTTCIVPAIVDVKPIEHARVGFRLVAGTGNLGQQLQVVGRSLNHHLKWLPHELVLELTGLGAIEPLSPVPAYAHLWSTVDTVLDYIYDRPRCDNGD